LPSEFLKGTPQRVMWHPLYAQNPLKNFRLK
jgi:hypothetical protein